MKVNRKSKKIQTGRDTKEEQMIAGHPPPAKRRKYRDANRCISILIDRFLNTNAYHPPLTIWEFFKAIAHNFAMDPRFFFFFLKCCFLFVFLCLLK